MSFDQIWTSCFTSGRDVLFLFHTGELRKTHMQLFTCTFLCPTASIVHFLHLKSENLISRKDHDKNCLDNQILVDALSGIC